MGCFAAGMGISTMLACMVGEKIAYGCSGIKTAMASNGLGSMPIMLAGNEEQKKKYLTRYSKKIRAEKEQDSVSTNFLNELTQPREVASKKMS
jgi:hypothetical protein